MDRRQTLQHWELIDDVQLSSTCKIDFIYDVLNLVFEDLFALEEIDYDFDYALVYNLWG